MFNIKKLVVLLLCAGLVFQAHFGIAGPQGGKVVGGNANISQSGPNTTINQTSDRAIINWNSFDIGKNESVRHNMPSSNSAGLHRVVGKGGPSQIEGLLQSNGNIYLVNPAGVVIHNGAKIDVNGFVATSRDIANDNFMKGKMVFDKPGLPGAAIINQGNISLRDNGLAALVAPTVRNDGIIAGKLGKVALGGSDAAWKLDMTGDDLIAFTMDEKQVNTLYAADGTPLASVQNNGKIKAEGGVVVLTASQLDGIVGSVVNNGEISAASAEMKGGKIIFRGQGNKVDVVNNGHLDISSKAAEGGNVRMTGQGAVTHAGKIDATGKTKGGNVVITGENVILKSGSRIDASGTNGGGTVLVGGNARGKGPEANAKTTLVQSDAEILADAKLFGDGGQIVVWADEKTQFDGKATARGGENGGDGGLVETSAKLLIIGDPAVVNTSAKKGKAGEWLLDPEDFVIAPSGGTMTGQQISDSLGNNNVIIKTGEDGEGNGDIFVNDIIVWGSNTELTLHAQQNITINSAIKAIGDTAGLRIESENGMANIYSKITLSGDDPILYILGIKYGVINSIEELQNINSSGYYVLGSDIDASGTTGWNNGLGFSPISNFVGLFNGFGHTINNIYINRPDETHVGLFGFIQSATISNIGLNDVFVVGGNQVGGLVGCSYTSDISNTYVTGQVAGNTMCGGLVGRIYGGNYGDDTSKHSVTNSFTNVKLSSIPKSWNHDLGEDLTHFGGITGLMDGWEGLAQNLYSIGYVPSLNKSGGLIGQKNLWVTIENCYFNKDTSSISQSAGGTGLTTAQMKNQASYRNWNFNNVWEISDTTGYPELKIFAVTEPLPAPNPDPDPDPDPNPNPDPDPNPNPEEPDNPDPKPDTPDTPDNPDVPVNPDPKPDTPDKPDKPVNPDPKPDTPITPEQPSNPGTNPGDTPSRPSIKPDTKPETPGTNQPVKPDTPVVPEQPSKPVQPENPVTPQQPSNPSTTPGGNTPSQPVTKPETPVTPNQPSNPGNNSGGNNNANSGTTQFLTGTTITYKVIDGNVHVFQDNQHIGIMEGNRIKIDNSDIPVVIEDGKTYVTGGDLQIIENHGNNTQTTENQTQNTLPNFSTSGHLKEPILYDTFQNEMNEFIDDVLYNIGQQFYSALETQKKADNEALKALKKDIKGTSSVPDDVYEAFANFVYNSLENSTITDPSKHLNEFLKQLLHSLLEANKSLEDEVTIGETVYKFSAASGGGVGAGMSYVTVRWIDPDSGRHMSSTLYFVSTPEKTMKTLLEYQTALMDIASEEMKEAISYFGSYITTLPKDKVRKFVDFGQELVEAMVDPQKGKEMGEKVFKESYNKYKPVLLGKFQIGGKNFEDFVIDNIPGGKQLKEVADKLKKVKDEFKQIQKLHESGKNLSKNQNILQALLTSNELSQYFTGKYHKLQQYFSENS